LFIALITATSSPFDLRSFTLLTLSLLFCRQSLALSGVQTVACIVVISLNPQWFICTLQSPHPSLTPLCFVHSGTALALRSLSLLAGRHSFALAPESRRYRLSYRFNSSSFFANRRAENTIIKGKESSYHGAAGVLILTAPGVLLAYL